MLDPKKVLALLLSANTHGSYDVPCVSCIRELVESFITMFPEHKKLAVQTFKDRFPEARLPYNGKV